jgi:hypothetical protein
VKQRFARRKVWNPQRDAEKELRHNSLHHLAVDVGEAILAALVAEGEAGVIDAAEMHDGGLHVVHMDAVGGNVPGEIVGSADFAAACGYPLIVVAANRLGCINHTLLTVEAACRPERGLSVALVVLNDLPDHTSDISRASNYAELARRLTVPLVRARENQLHPWPELERLVPLGGK